MARSVINNNSVEPLGLPNSGDSVEMGDTWNVVVAKLNAMFTEIYGGSAPVGKTTGSTAAAITAAGVIDLSTIGDYTLAAPAAAGIFCDVVFRSTQGSTASGTSIILSAASGVTFDGLNTVARATAATVPNKALQLVALSTARWAIVANNGLTGTLGLATA